MRAGVGAVQHTLTPAAAGVVRAAVAEAKKRGHSQVQPLHVAAILLIQSTPGSPLRRACLQSHSKDLSHPLQCRALELCFKIALDRLPSNTEKTANPVLSNALVAALKRAQAHQRRGTPEQSLQPLLAVKVEMDQLIISILDDPSVSRVMREAGFCSTHVKSNMEEAAAQSSPSVTCSSSSLDSTSQLRRRERLSATPLWGSPLEGVHRHSIFTSSPFAIDSSDNLRLVEGAIMSSLSDAQPEKESSCLGPFGRQDGDAHAFSVIPPPFLENSPLYKKRQDNGRVHHMLGPSLIARAVRPSNHEEDVKNVVEILSRPTKRNPVLVCDVVGKASIAIQEFSHRLKRGDVPTFLLGVEFMTFPVNSLSIGMLTKEETEEKLAGLRKSVEGSVYGGVILSVGDLQWLVDSDESGGALSHTYAHLVVQELGHLLVTHASDRLWLLSSASSQTFVRCQVSHSSLENRWGLQPVLVAANKGLGLHSRFGSHQSKVNGEPSLPGQADSVNGPIVKLSNFETGQDKVDCCPDCTRKYQQECSILIKEEQLTSPSSSVAPGNSGMEFNGLLTSTTPQPPWLQKQRQMKWPPLVTVKEEKIPILSQRLQEVRKKWEQTCSSHHSNSGSLPSIISDAPRDFPSSIHVPDKTVDLDKTSQTRHSLLASMSNEKWLPESVKSLPARSFDLPSRIMTGADAPHWATAFKPVGTEQSRDAQGVATAGRASDGQSIALGGWMSKSDADGSGDSKSGVSSQGETRDTMGADLALGRSSVELLPQTRNLREEGQQPILGGWQVPNNMKSLKDPVCEVSLPWQAQSMGPNSSVLSSDKPTEQKPPAVPAFRPSDASSLNDLCGGLQEMVHWQKEAIATIASTVIDCRSGMGRKRGTSLTSDTWLMFLGPDRVGKREIAKGVAKLVFGCEKKLIWMKLSGNQGHSTAFGTSSGILSADSNGVRYRGKTPLDRLVEAVRLKPFSVVLLEDVDQADSVVRGNLLRAMERGKLAASNGREVSFANVIVIMTCGVGGDLMSPNRNPDEKDPIDLNEDKLSRLSSYGMRFLVEDSTSEKVLHENGRGLSVVDCSSSPDKSSADAETDHCLSSSPLSLKRKTNWLETDMSGTVLAEKRNKKEGSSSSKTLALDLNLSAEENESVDELSCMTDVNTSEKSERDSPERFAQKLIACARECLPKEMLGLVDATVVFKPFDFQKLSESVLDQLDSAARNVVSTGARVEIDIRVLEQLVSAAWQTISDKNVFHGWVSEVLSRSVSGLVQNCGMGPTSVVKLVLERAQTLETKEHIPVRVGLLPASIGVGQ